MLYAGSAVCCVAMVSHRDVQLNGVMAFPYDIDVLQVHRPFLPLSDNKLE